METSDWVDSVLTDDQDSHGAGWELGAYLYTGADTVVFMDGFESGDAGEWTIVF